MIEPLTGVQSRSEVEAALREFLADRSKLLDIEDVSSDEELFASGILDSFAFADLVVFVESVLGADPGGAGEVTMESFGTIDSIIEHVVAGGRQPAPSTTRAPAGDLATAEVEASADARFMTVKDLTITPAIAVGMLVLAAVAVVGLRRIVPLGIVETWILWWFLQEWMTLGVLWVMRRLWPLVPGVYAADHPARFRWNLFGILTTTNLYVSNSILPPPIFRKLLYLMMGARLERGIMSIGGQVTEPELLEMGRGAMIGGHTLLLSHAFNRQGGRDLLILGRIRIGRNVIIGARCIIMPDVVIDDGAMVNAGSIVAMGSRIGSDEVWGGAPAVRLAGHFHGRHTRPLSADQDRT